MTRTDVHLLDLPNEILFTILNKLDNMSVLHSLIGIGNKRLDQLAQDKTFTNILNFVSTDICSINDSILNRFCIDILPRIQYNVKCLIIEAINMERVLSAGNYSNLTELKIFDFNQHIASRYFTDELLFQHIFKQQITDLTLINNDNQHETRNNYTANVYVRIFNLFVNLKHLTIARPSIDKCPPLSLRGLPSTTFYSSTLTKLCASVHYFEDCLVLLDGRLKQLTTFIIFIDCVNNDSVTVSNSGDLPNLKCFSVTYTYLTYQYEIEIVPLLRRMCNLEELRLYLSIDDRAKLIDGTQLHNEILIHLPRLHTFKFYISTRIVRSQSVPNLSNDEIRRTFIDIGYEQITSIINDVIDGHNVCNIFSLPFAFDRLEMIGNNFPNIIFHNVAFLWLYDSVPFKHEFFIRIAQSFPLLKDLIIMNSTSQLSESDPLEFYNNDQSYSIATYPHLTILDLIFAHTDYAEQLLHESKTHLPHLTELKMEYDQLQIVTENFTRDATRLNCSKVTRLIIDMTIVHPKDFYIYFPLL